MSDTALHTKFRQIDGKNHNFAALHQIPSIWRKN